VADRTFTPLGSRARLAVFSLGVVAVLEVISVLFDVVELNTIDDYKAGNATYEDLVQSDNRQATLALVVALGTVVCAIFFIRWFHAAYRNLGALDGSTPRFGSGWAIGAWFVPFLNLWRPKQMADEIGTATAADDAGSRISTGALITIWWALWVAGFVAGLAERGASADETVDTRHVVHIDIAWSAINLAAAALAVLVVLRLTAGQETRRSGVLAGQTALPV